MITRHEFGVLEPDGMMVHNYTMKNATGMTVTISEYGGTIVEIKVPDKFGRSTNVVCGFDSLRDYVLGGCYVGALVGRTSNRISNAKFVLDGKEYKLYPNWQGVSSLHGGKVGYSCRIWSVKPVDGDEPKLILTLHSDDGEEGYPGNLDVTVTYTLLAGNALSIHYEATTDKRTPVELTNHAYFNLGGYASGPIYDHVLQIEADAYLPTDKNLSITGEIRPVAGTPFDFREPKAIGRDINEENEDLAIGMGYDNAFVFTGGATAEPVLRVMVYEPNSGRILKVFTDQPAVQFYSGNMLAKNDYPFQGGYPQTKQHAFCLEAEALPDSVNQPNFPNTILSPGETYHQTTIYQFSVKQ